MPRLPLDVCNVISATLLALLKFNGLFNVLTVMLALPEVDPGCKYIYELAPELADESKVKMALFDVLTCSSDVGDSVPIPTFPVE